jgi:hypothetical protein
MGTDTTATMRTAASVGQKMGKRDTGRAGDDQAHGVIGTGIGNASGTERGCRPRIMLRIMLERERLCTKVDVT